MDIYCPICGEPFDIDSLHDAVEEGIATNFSSALEKFKEKGCNLWGYLHCTTGVEGKERAEISSALFDILGDDVDGIAAMMEDYEMGYY
jgi:hypothetical protein